MLKSIELNSHIRNRLAEYLKGRGMDFQTAMQEEKATKKSPPSSTAVCPLWSANCIPNKKCRSFFGKSGI